MHQIELIKDVSQHQMMTRILNNKYISAIFDKLHPCILDIGANDGITFSNSFNLIKQFGWRGVLFEPQKHLAQEAFDLYKSVIKQEGLEGLQVNIIALGISDPEDPHFLSEKRKIAYNNGGSSLCGSLAIKDDYNNCLRHKVEIVQLSSVINQIPDKIGIMSIDTEGWDYYVVCSLLRTEIRPQIIITEFTPFDGLLAALKSNKLKESGYVLLDTIVDNEVYIQKKLLRYAKIRNFLSYIGRFFKARPR